MKKFILFLIVLLNIVNFSYATEPVDYQLEELKLIRQDLNSGLDSLSVKNDDILNELFIANKYIMLIFLVLSLLGGFLIGYLLGRKKV